jgi:molybdopterin-containing oxidoreductase family iron-sulfur binding subunit
MKKSKVDSSERRKFFKLFITGGLGILASKKIFTSIQNNSGEDEKLTVLTTDGKLIKVLKSQVEEMHHHPPVTRTEARKGIPGKKFVLVVDLSRCRNARKCIEGCEKHHKLTPDRPFIKVLKMQDNPRSSPYWMPKKCFQCDNPPCVKVCPVGATFKRSDNIVLIDNERCIGCRFCMAACPYSARVFNWGEPKPIKDYNDPYSPETSVPSKRGTVEKCDFCPDMLRENKLPPCITACPNGTLFFGNALEDSVTNGSETFRLSKLLRDKAAYRYMDDLGTQPNVYYLPPVDRLFPFKDREIDKKS